MFFIVFQSFRVCGSAPGIAPMLPSSDSSVEASRHSSLSGLSRLPCATPTEARGTTMEPQEIHRHSMPNEDLTPSLQSVSGCVFAFASSFTCYLASPHSRLRSSECAATDNTDKSIAYYFSLTVILTQMCMYIYKGIHVRDILEYTLICSVACRSQLRLGRQDFCTLPRHVR